MSMEVSISEASKVRGSLSIPHGLLVTSRQMPAQFGGAPSIGMTIDKE